MPGKGEMEEHGEPSTGDLTETMYTVWKNLTMNSHMESKHQDFVIKYFITKYQYVAKWLGNI